MAQAKQASKRKRRVTALPVMGVAGMTLSLAGGASAATTGPVVDNPALKVGPQPQITLGEEEIADVSLSTFYVFDRENSVKPSQLGEQLAWGCRCGGGCRGCRCGGRCGFRGCGGCGCGVGCCASWGRCRWC
jgi:hypothetical protein